MHAAKTGACVINSCGWVDGGGYKALLHVAKAFEGILTVIVCRMCVCVRACS